MESATHNQSPRSPLEFQLYLAVYTEVKTVITGEGADPSINPPFQQFPIHHSLDCSIKFETWS